MLGLKILLFVKTIIQMVKMLL